MNDQRGASGNYQWRSGNIRVFKLTRTSFSFALAFDQTSKAKELCTSSQFKSSFQLPPVVSPCLNKDPSNLQRQRPSAHVSFPTFLWWFLPLLAFCWRRYVFFSFASFPDVLPLSSRITSSQTFSHSPSKTSSFLASRSNSPSFPSSPSSRLMSSPRWVFFAMKIWTHQSPNFSGVALKSRQSSACVEALNSSLTPLPAFPERGWCTPQW